MGNEIITQKQIYDAIYSNMPKYNYYDDMKNAYVDAYSMFIEGKLLDAGCGEGIHLKRLLDKGYDVVGIELSEVCCNKYLQGLPFENTDIVSFAKTNRRFAGILCMDVLEHIPIEDVEITLSALSSMAPSLLLGIANHSDIFDGVELHQVQEDREWWGNKLRNHFENVDYIDAMYGGRFFFVHCHNHQVPDLVKYLPKLCEILRSLIPKYENLKNERESLTIRLSQQDQQMTILNQEIGSLNHQIVSLGITPISVKCRWCEKIRKFQTSLKSWARLKRGNTSRR